MQAAIGEQVKVLLALKGDFKAATGLDWKPDIKLPAAAPAAPVAATATAGNAVEINEKIAAQGDKIRQLKASKATKVSWLYFYLVDKAWVLVLLFGYHWNFQGSFCVCTQPMKDVTM